MQDDAAQVEVLERRLSGVSDALGLAAASPAAGSEEAPVRWLVCGPLGAGKTTLVNALLRPLSPAAPGGGTAAVIRLHDGPEWSAAAIPADPAPPLPLTEAELAAWDAGAASEDVSHLDVAAPNPLLARGLEIIDTPGIGGLHGTAAHPLFLWAEDARRILFVTAADQAPLGARDAAILRRLAALPAPLVLVQTKTDLVGEAEAEALRQRNLAVTRAALGTDVDRLATLAVNPTLMALASRKGVPDDRRARLLGRSGHSALLAMADEDLEARQAALTRRRAASIRQNAARLHDLVAAPGAARLSPAHADELLEQFLVLKRRRCHGFVHAWRGRFSELMHTIEDDLEQQMDDRPNGSIVAPILQDLRARAVSVRELQTAECACDIGDRCIATCNERLAVIVETFRARAQSLTQELATAEGIDLDGEAAHLVPALSGHGVAGFSFVQESRITQLTHLLGAGAHWSELANKAIEIVQTAGLCSLVGFGLPSVGGLVGALFRLLGSRREARERAYEIVQQNLSGQVARARERVLRRFERAQDDICSRMEGEIGLCFDQIEQAFRLRLRAALGGAQPQRDALAGIAHDAGRLESALAP